MADIKEKDQSTAPAPQTAAVSAEPAKTEKPKSFSVAHTMSKGEKVFEWTVYRGLNYWVNLISSVIFTDWFKNLGGRKKLRIDKFSHFLATHMPGSNPYEKKLEFALKTFDYLALTSGGTVLVWPLKELEKNKRKVVHWINDKLGVDQTAADGHKLTPDEIYIEKEQPKSTWFNVIWRRGLGMASVAAGGHLLNYTFKTPGTDGKMIDGNTVVTDFVLKGSSDKADGGVNRVLNAVPGGKFLVNNERTQAWMGFAVLDSVFTQLTAAIMWATNGAKKKQMPKEIEECVPAVQNVVAAEPAADTQAPDRSALKAKKPAASASHIERSQQPTTGLAMAP